MSIAVLTSPSWVHGNLQLVLHTNGRVHILFKIVVKVHLLFLLSFIHFDKTWSNFFTAVLIGTRWVHGNLHSVVCSSGLIYSLYTCSRVHTLFKIAVKLKSFIHFGSQPYAFNNLFVIKIVTVRYRMQTFYFLCCEVFDK